MNAVTNPSLRPEESRASALSALVDGELSPDELDAVLASLAEPHEGLQDWSRYQLIGDVLRGSAPVAATRSPQDFLAGIQAQLQTSTPLVSSPPELMSAGASTAAVRHTVQPDAPAANDPVFRWKMVAGLASLAAVMAVSWTLLGTTPGAPGGQGNGAQMALVASPLMPTRAGSSTDPVRTEPRSEPVVVNTAQGPVLRDPQLEALMAQHRRYGDMSALQMPSGFLRNATHDAPAR